MSTNGDVNVFLISLPEKEDLQSPFISSIKNISLVPAVDARDNGFVYKDFGLSLDPPDKIAKIEFSKNKGAIGCYLSHYSIWKQIVSDNLEYSLILEDDANVDDVRAVLNSNTIQNKLNTDKPTLIQLNKRTTEDKLPWWFDGTESYAINKAAAEKLLHNTYDFSDLQNKFIEYAWNWPALKRGVYGLFKKYEPYDKRQDFYSKNTIRYAVDKFIGYCALPYVNPKNRINVIIDNKVGLVENNVSEIRRGKQVWEMSEIEIENFEKDKSYMWWDAK